MGNRVPSPEELKVLKDYLDNFKFPESQGAFGYYVTKSPEERKRLQEGCNYFLTEKQIEEYKRGPFSFPGE